MSDATWWEDRGVSMADAALYIADRRGSAVPVTAEVWRHGQPVAKAKTMDLPAMQGVIKVAKACWFADQVVVAVPCPKAPDHLDDQVSDYAVVILLLDHDGWDHRTWFAGMPKPRLDSAYRGRDTFQIDLVSASVASVTTGWAGPYATPVHEVLNMAEPSRWSASAVGQWAEQDAVALERLLAFGRVGLEAHLCAAPDSQRRAVLSTRFGHLLAGGQRS